MYSLWNFFLSRRAFTVLAMISLLIAGAYALNVIPKESSPEVVVPIGIVTTVLPGATASDVEQLVTDKLEPSIRNVANIDEVTSSSRSGVSVITAQFVASADIDSSIQDLRNAVEGARAELPSDAEVPTVTKFDFQNQPILMVGVGTDLAPEALTQLGEDLQDELIAIQGVSKVEVAGTRARQISIIVHKNSLAQHNIRVEQVISALRNANASAPAGTITIDDVNYPIQFEGKITDIEDIRTTPIATPTGEITVADIATIIDGFQDTSSISRIKVEGKDSQFALSLNIYKSSSDSIIEVSNRVKDRLKELEETLLTGSTAVITYDTADEVRTSITDLSTSGLQTVLLVMLVLFIAIGFKDALVAAMAIPFSFMIAFLGMFATGNTINFISLFSLIIAIGILVDSGIVVVEGIHTNRENGLDRYAAARKAIRDFGWPLIAGTMTTVAVFIPLFFLSGIIGEFIKSIPFTIVVVLIASIIVSLGFVPSIALHLIKHEKSSFAVKRERLWRSISAWYRKHMQLLFAHRRMQWLFYGVLAIFFVGALALPVTGALKVAMFPPSDYNLFYIEVELPQATALTETDAVARHVESIASEIPYLESLTTTVGAASVFNQNSPGAGTKYANITVNLKENRGDLSSLEITDKLRRDIALTDFGNANVSVFDVDGGPPSGAPIVVKIWSNDTDKLALATEMIENVLEDTSGTRDITSSLANDGTELQISIDRDAANEYGLSTTDIASTLRAAVAGVEATKVRIEGNDLEVRVMFDLNPNFIGPEDTTIAGADEIRNIPIATSRGTVPLGSLTTITADRTSAAISHENGMRIGSVHSYVTENANVIEVTNAVRNAAEQLELPEGVHLTYGGEDEEIQKTFTEMLVALGAGLVLMFAILVLEFNTFSRALRLLSAIPLSLTGVLWGLWLTGQPLSFTAFLGIIALAGVIINHGILLLDAMNTRYRENPDITPHDLVLDTAESRVRPILLTTVTTVVGMIPLVFVDAMWAPLAFTIAFGLLYGTVLTLVFIPLLSYRRELKRVKQK
ncbi:MAG: efflux RND transporter permease subunit [Patescibacteria group bacterium UBA2163]